MIIKNPRLEIVWHTNFIHNAMKKIIYFHCLWDIHDYQANNMDKSMIEICYIIIDVMMMIIMTMIIWFNQMLVVIIIIKKRNNHYFRIPQVLFFLIHQQIQKIWAKNKIFRSSRQSYKIWNRKKLSFSRQSSAYCSSC